MSIVTCESCQTKYNFPDDKIKETGTKVRCSECDHIFKVFPEKEASPFVEEEELDLGGFNDFESDGDFKEEGNDTKESVFTDDTDEIDTELDFSDSFFEDEHQAEAETDTGSNEDDLIFFEETEEDGIEFTEDDLELDFEDEDLSLEAPEESSVKEAEDSFPFEDDQETEFIEDDLELEFDENTNEEIKSEELDFTSEEDLELTIDESEGDLNLSFEDENLELSIDEDDLELSFDEDLEDSPDEELELDLDLKSQEEDLELDFDDDLSLDVSSEDENQAFSEDDLELSLDFEEDPAEPDIFDEDPKTGDNELSLDEEEPDLDFGSIDDELEIDSTDEELNLELDFADESSAEKELDLDLNPGSDEDDLELDFDFNEDQEESADSHELQLELDIDSDISHEEDLELQFDFSDDTEESAAENELELELDLESSPDTDDLELSFDDDLELNLEDEKEDSSLEPTKEIDDIDLGFDLDRPQKDTEKAVLEDSDGLAEASIDLHPAEPEEASKKKKSGNLIFLLILLLLVSLGAGFYYTAMNTDILENAGIKLPWIQKDVKDSSYLDPGNQKLDASADETRFLDTEKSGYIMILNGKVTNNYPYPVKKIKLKAELLLTSKEVASRKIFYAGNQLSDLKMKSMTIAEIENELNKPFGDKNFNSKIDPGKSIPFMVVFSDLPENAAEVSFEPISSEPF